MTNEAEAQGRGELDALVEECWNCGSVVLRGPKQRTQPMTDTQPRRMCTCPKFGDDQGRSFFCPIPEHVAEARAMPPAPHAGQTSSGLDALVEETELCWQNRCAHMPTGYGKEYDGHRRDALRRLAERAMAMGRAEINPLDVGGVDRTIYR